MCNVGSRYSKVSAKTVVVSKTDPVDVFSVSRSTKSSPLQFHSNISIRDMIFVSAPGNHQVVEFVFAQKPAVGKV